MLFKIFGDSLRVLNVTFHAQTQRLDTLDGLPAIERSLASADITQNLHTCFDRKWRQASFFQVRVDQTVIRRIGRGKVFKLATPPIVIAAVDNDAADGGAMSADEFGGAVGDDVCAPLERAEEIRRGEGIVNH